MTLSPGVNGPDAADLVALGATLVLPHSYVIVGGSGKQRKWVSACHTLGAARWWAAHFWNLNPIIYRRVGRSWSKVERS